MEQQTTSREKILKKVRKALITKGADEVTDIDFDSEVYLLSDDSPEISFAQKFTKLNGKFIFCETVNDFSASLISLLQENNWSTPFVMEPEIKKILTTAGIAFEDSEDKFNDLNVGITACEYLISRTGSVIVSSAQASGRRLNVYPNYHIVVAYASQIVDNHKVALQKLKEKYRKNLPSLISSITGPSRTADIEKTLVQGAHGPKEIFVFLIDDIHNS